MRLAAVCLAQFALTTACTPAPPAPADSLSPGSVAERTAKLDVPAGFAPFHMQFVDSRHGYAMFAKFGEKRAEVVLFRTVDGGVSWTKLAHPQPVAPGQQMYPVDAKTIVLLSEPDMWHVSKDGGQTWKLAPVAADAAVLAESPRGSDFGQFYLDRGPNYDGPALIRDREDGAYSFPVPTGYEAGSLTNDIRDHRIWLVALKDGHPVTMISSRGTKDFAEVAVPKQPGRPLFHAHVVISHDRKDVWLLADQEDVGASGGKSAMRGSVLKGAGLPLVWKLENSAWVAKPITGIQEKAGWPYSVVPVGDGALLVTALDQARYVMGGGTQSVPGIEYVSLLRDGALQGSQNQQGVVFLGEGSGTVRAWVRVEVMALQS